MKIELKIKKEFDVTTLKASCHVRYWEDATVDGVKDEKGNLIPCRDGDNWCPIIDLNTGTIKNWKKGITADIHYKVCDEGEYELIDINSESIIKKEGYVPDVMCPEENGYGDYVIMKINEDGIIQNWECDLSDFNIEDD